MENLVSKPYVTSDLGLHCLPMTLFRFPCKNGLNTIAALSIEHLKWRCHQGGLSHGSGAGCSKLMTSLVTFC